MKRGGIQGVLERTLLDKASYTHTRLQILKDKAPNMTEYTNIKMQHNKDKPFDSFSLSKLGLYAI